MISNDFISGFDILSHGSGACLKLSEMQGCPGSPTQAELGQAGGVPIPPSTPSLNGRYANEPGGKGSGKGSGCGMPCAGSAMPCLFPGGFGGNSMPADISDPTPSIEGGP